MNAVDWPEPWWPTADQDAGFHDTFHRQLQRELSAEHPLHGLPVQLLARGDGDDALFLIADGSARVAQVHLTWSNCRQTLPWPLTRIHESLQDWLRSVGADSA